MAKIALIEKQPSKIKYEQYFDFDFDKYQLCSDPSVKRILKRDTDIDIDTDQYDWLVLVGSEPVKHFTSVSSVTDYSGKKVDSKFLPVISPAMLAFKPEAKKAWDESVASIHGYISGDIEEAIIDEKVAFGIQDTQEANEFIKQAIKHPSPYIALDS